MAAISQNIDIIEVRAHLALPTDGSTSQSNIPDVRHQILQGLSAPPGEKSLPTLLLYDEEGLRLYDRAATQSREYYLFSAEEEILKRHGDEIARCMHANFEPYFEAEALVELGAGSLRKTSHILRSIARLFPSIPDNPPITYYALDLERRELDRTLRELSSSETGREIHGKITAKGLCATYEEGLEFIRQGGLRESVRSTDDLSAHYRERLARDTSPSSDTSVLKPRRGDPLRHILFLGSSLGNFARGEDSAFLRSLPLRLGSGDTLLLGLDHDNGREKTELAYKDSQGLSPSFIMNGLTHAGRILGLEEFFDKTKWKYFGVFNEKERRYETYYKSKESQQVADPTTETTISILHNELVRIAISQKYSEDRVFSLFAEANLRPVHRWMDSASQYSLWLLERPALTPPSLAKPARANIKLWYVTMSTNTN